MPKPRLLTSSAALLLLALLLSSCSASFEREWKAALKNGSGSSSSIEGAYAGAWRSEATGHQGKLRCIVGPRVGDTHEFHYHATWMGILSGAYRSKHHVRPNAGGATFEGQHQMPAWAGGLYTYQGTIQGDDFRATYRCPKDHGAYTLQRVR